MNRKGLRPTLDRMLRRFHSPSPTALATALLLGIALAGCVRNPATGRSELALISDSQARQMGQEAAEQIAQTVGLYDDAELQAYVRAIGAKVAATSHRPDEPWQFAVMDDPAVNAFALPGGFVYVTRGILAHLPSEAALASVLGHEVGHVTARHSVTQISRAQVAQLGLGIGALLVPEIAPFAGIAEVGLGLLLLSYGRDAESEADLLGFQYALDAGFDPREMMHVFEILGAVGGDERGRVPGWLSTHPDPADRLEETRERLTQVGELPPNLSIHRDAFLKRVDGLVYGADPRKGFFVDSRFVHPELRFQLDFPSGWTLQNQAAAVVGVSPQQDALVAIGLAPTLPPEEALGRFLATDGIRGTQPIVGPIGDQPAAASYFQAAVQDGVVEGFAAFISWQNRTFRLLGYTRRGALPAFDQVFRTSMGSFRPLTEPEFLDVSPARIEVMRVENATTLEELQRAFPSEVSLEELASLNGVDVGETLKKGAMVKRVVGGKWPGRDDAGHRLLK